MIKVCQKCGKKFEYTKRTHWIVKYCSNKCKWSVMNKRFWEKHKEEQRKIKLNYYYKMRSTEKGLKRLKEINYRANLKRRFAIKSRNEIMEKYKNLCVFCGNKATLIHHLDRNGRGNKNPNNDIKNLVACCHSCHAKIHLGNKVLQMKTKSDTPSNGR